MGLWLIQNVKNELENNYSENVTFQELSDGASTVDILSVIDCNDDRLLAPESMIDTIKEMCKESNQEIPKNAFEIANVVYRSLAHCYSKTAKEIENITGREFENIYIIGGGAKAEYLNKMTAEISGKNVVAMPIEGTATGNLIVQMIANKEFENLFEARSLISSSFDKKVWK